MGFGLRRASFAVGTSVPTLLCPPRSAHGRAAMFLQYKATTIERIFAGLSWHLACLITPKSAEERRRAPKSAEHRPNLAGPRPAIALPLGAFHQYWRGHASG